MLGRVCCSGHFVPGLFLQSPAPSSLQEITLGIDCRIKNTEESFIHLESAGDSDSESSFYELLVGDLDDEDIPLL